MVSISNELSRTSPIPESVLESEAVKSFESCGEQINLGIDNYLASLTKIPEAQGYKYIVNVTSIDSSTRGPIKTFTGAYWKSDQDGTWATHLKSLGLLVSVTWVHT